LAASIQSATLSFRACDIAGAGYFLECRVRGGGELYALSTGRTPPAEEYVLKNWKRLETTVDATEEAINKITYESARDILGNIQRQQYHTLETKVLRTEWKRPTH
jgi:hypothetical protein